MTITHRERPALSNPQRAAFTPPAARGFAPRGASRQEDEADENEVEDIAPDEGVASERRVHHVPGSKLPPRRDADAAPVRGGPSPIHRPAAAGVQASEPAASPDSIVPATPAAPTSPVAHTVAASPAMPVAPAQAPAAGPAAGLGLLTSQEAASILRITPQRLESWRRKGIGPAFIKINARTVHYRAADIDSFLAVRLRPGASA